MEVTDRYKLYHGDCIEVMDELIGKEVKVDLTVTSPPYDDLRNYNNSLVWDFDIFKKVADRLYEMTKEGGIVVWVVGDKTKNGSETGTSFKQALYFKEIGFKLHDTMIWKKTNPFNFGSNNCYIQSFEYMFILVKGKIKTTNFIKDRINKTYKENKKCIQQRRTRNGDFMEYDDKYWEMDKYGKRYNVWEMKTSNKFKNHTATFPEELARDHIISWSNEGDIVFDCFMGSGTTGKMALLNNRKFIGIEKVKEYFEISKERIEESLSEENNKYVHGRLDELIIKKDEEGDK